MKGSKEDAVIDFWAGLYEEPFFSTGRNDKRRVCVFCGIQIFGGFLYYKNKEFPYEKNLPRWFACLECGDKVPQKNIYSPERFKDTAWLKQAFRGGIWHKIWG